MKCIFTHPSTTGINLKNIEYAESSYSIRDKIHLPIIPTRKKEKIIGFMGIKQNCTSPAGEANNMLDVSSGES